MRLHRPVLCQWREGRPPGFEEGHRRCHEDIQSGLPQMLDLICPGGRVLQLFALQATAELGEAVARSLGQPLAKHEERQFEDGEHKTRPLDPVGEQMSMSCKAFTVAPPRVQTTSFVGSCFSSAPSKMPGPPASRPSCPTFATRGRIAAPSRTIRSLPDMWQAYSKRLAPMCL